MAKTYDEVKAELDSKLPADSVSTRDAGQGRSLSYVSSYYVLEQMNRIVGQGNWAYETQEMRLVYEGSIEGESYGKKVTTYNAHYVAKVLLVVDLPEGKKAMFSDYGYGDGSDKKSPGKAHELAVKEAATDALKRCIKNLGMRMGLALYDKEQTNVEEEPSTIRTSITRSETNATGDGARVNGTASKPTETKERIQAQSGASTSPKEREKVNAAITSAARVLHAQGKAQMSDIKSILSTTYKVGKKEELTDVQAKEFLAKLEEMQNAQAVQ